MEEVKRAPGRPAKIVEDTPVKVRYVQMHDAFTPLQMAPIMSLSTMGDKAVQVLQLSFHGVYVERAGRKFIVPFGNISFLELE
jgi:hypothetical protein